jgi:DNA-binding transcriptional MocR family regulator
LYTIPTFHNPTGISLSAERRAELVAVAAAEELLIIEDDVYRELSYDEPAPASLWSIAPTGTVIRLGSFAKSLAPGLRLGWVTGSAEHVQRIVGSGLRDSGGGVNHFASMVVATFCRTGQFEAQVARLRAEYRARRDALLTAVAAYLSPECAWTQPAGGYFLWITLPDGMNAQLLLPFAEAAGVSFVPGQRFFANGGGSRMLRLAFSLYDAEALREGAQRLGQALHTFGSR